MNLLAKRELMIRSLIATEIWKRTSKYLKNAANMRHNIRVYRILLTIYK